jgi:polyketide cyclase/dehydrase/lipid transport protein
MRPMTRLVLGLAVLVGILAAVALGLPSHVTVTRSVVINAPEPVIFPYLNNLHQFSEWSPWQLRDPKLAVSYSGPEQGKGAKVQWTSEVPSIGTGSMEIAESEPSRHIDLAVNFNGLEGTGSYDLSPAGSGSKVTWAFGYDSGTSPLKRWKALMLDGFVGAEYRAGLDRLKEKIESERRPTAPSIVETPPGGVSTEAEQPSAALPPGAAPPQGAAVPPGQAGAPAAGAAQTGSTPGAAQPNAAPPTAAEATPAPAPAPKPPKKKRRNQ